MRAFNGFGLLLALCCLSGLQAQIPVALRGELPEVVGESSGLLLLGDRFLTHNDSGNLPVLYELDTTNLSVLREVTIAGVENRDWEDLAEDSQYIYVGDIGNNQGSRTDLKILRIAKADLQGSLTVSADLITYAYEDQTDFSGGSNSDWDAEALEARGDSLYIFTKQWQSGGTTVYSLPKAPGNYMARRGPTYAVGGLVTAAASAGEGSALYLLGYSMQLQPFLVTIPSATNPFAFPPETRKEQLEIAFGQTEGLAVGLSGRLYVSSEAFSNALLQLAPSVFTVDLPAEPGPEDPPGEDPDPGGEDPEVPLEPGDGLVLFRTPNSPYLEYRLDRPGTLLARAVYDAAGRRVLFQNAWEAEPGRVDISGLGTAVYYLTLYLRGETLSEPFLSY